MSLTLFATVLKPILVARILAVVADVPHHLDVREPLGVLAVAAPLHALRDLVLGGAAKRSVPGASTRAAMLDLG